MTKNRESPGETGRVGRSETWFNANISSAFQVLQKLYAHFTKLCLAVFCKFFGDFCKIWRNKKY